MTATSDRHAARLAIQSIIPDTSLREAEMRTTEQHSNIPSTAVEIEPGLWRTSLQRYDLSVP
jgi:hypothetical protein